MNTNQIIEIIIDNTDLRPFELCSGTPKQRAQKQLEGKTHYVDESTLKYFKCRIVSALPVSNGLFFKIIENLPNDPTTNKKGFRAVVFDVFGEIIFRLNLDEMSKTAHLADTAFYKWFEKFNETEHYIRKFQEESNTLQKQANKMRNCVHLLNQTEKV